ncbi:MAG: metalloprotease TldD [Brevundimonas sp.]
MSIQSAAARRARLEAELLAPNDLDVRKVEQALDALWGKGADFADLYFEKTARDHWMLEQGLVARASFSISQGVGARAVSGDRTAFAYSSDIGVKGVRAVAEAARSMQLQGQDTASEGGRMVRLRAPEPDAGAYPGVHAAGRLDAALKVAMLRRVDALARARDPRIVEVTANLSVEDSAVLVAATDGDFAGDVRPLVRLAVVVMAEAGGRRSRGQASGGGRYDLEALGENMVDRLVDRAVETALVNLEARPAPAGEMTVVLGRGSPGILFHEAVGHGLEGDFHRKRSSVFADLMGEEVAAPGVTVIDDATLPGGRGSLNVDDEGVAGQRTVLIEDGRLVDLMQDKTNGRLMNSRSSGNGRRQSYAHLPMPRMTNTFLSGGELDPLEIIASVKHGIYAAEFGEGTVDITSGQFNFSTERAYLIEDGKVTAPIEGATLIGVGHQTLKRISMIGNDFSLDDGSGTCGKSGQGVPVGLGQPTMRIDEVVVGGAGA